MKNRTTGPPLVAHHLTLRLPPYSYVGAAGVARWLSLASMEVHEFEALIQKRFHAHDPAPRAELLHVLVLPDLERAERRVSIP